MISKDKLEEIVGQVFKNTERKFILQNAHFKMTESDVEFYTEEGKKLFNDVIEEELKVQQLKLFNKDG